MEKVLDKQGLKKHISEAKKYIKEHGGSCDCDNYFNWRRLGENGGDNGMIVGKENAVAGDILLWDGSKKYIMNNPTLELLQQAKDNGHTPIGIVVIPTSHNVYGTGECGVMSLLFMDTNNPDTGSQDPHPIISYGHRSEDIGAKYYSKLPIIGSTEFQQSEVIGESTYSYAYLPTDKFNNDVRCIHDSNACYRYSGTGYEAAPSPYLTDGSRNPMYYQTESPSSENNYLSDFEGLSNSKLLWDMATAQEDWKISETIISDNGMGYSPAACCCWRFHTKGTNQGDWYFPAIGEIGYIMSRISKISDSLVAIADNFSIPTLYYALINLSNKVLLSSTRKSSSNIICIDVAWSQPNTCGYTGDNRIVALIRI